MQLVEFSYASRENNSFLIKTQLLLRLEAHYIWKNGIESAAVVEGSELTKSHCSRSRSDPLNQRVKNANLLLSHTTDSSAANSPLEVADRVHTI